VKKRVRGQVLTYRRIGDGHDNPDLNQFLFSSRLNDAKNSDLLSDTASNFGEEWLSVAGVEKKIRVLF
jgi:hypothetical protein